MKQLVSIIYILVFISLLSCSDTSEPSIASLRYVYYPVSRSDGGHDGETGLYRININDMASEHLVPTSTGHLTNVGKNGVIVLEYDELSDDRKLWGKCEDGSIIQVPFPTVDNIAYEYKLIMPPNIMLSADGHNVAYFVNYQLIDDDNPWEKELFIVKFNCSTGNMDLINLDSALKDNFINIEANYFEPFGKYLQISKDGKKVWAAVKGTNYSDGKTSYRIIMLDGMATKAISDYLSEPIEIYSLNSITNNLIVKIGSEFRLFDAFGEFGNLSLTQNNFFQPYQVMTARAEMVIWTEFGIEIVNPDNVALLNRVISFEDIDPAGELEFMPNKRLSISHDGEYIVFALPIKGDTSSYRLFIVERNGKNLRVLKDKIKLGIPVISDKLENKETSS